MKGKQICVIHMAYFDQKIRIGCNEPKDICMLHIQPSFHYDQWRHQECGDLLLIILVDTKRPKNNFSQTSQYISCIID